MGQLVVPRQLVRQGLDVVPSPIAAAGAKATKRFFEFFAANIRNKNTRAAYYRAVLQFFAWCERKRIALERVEPILVAAYIEQLGETLSKPTVKQHLAAIRMLFDYLVTGQVVPFNPASSVRGPAYVIKKGKTPVLDTEQARSLLDSIDVSHVVGLRDRAVIATMIYTFARVGAVVAMKVEDYYLNGKRSWVRLHEKGGKFHEVPCHHKLVEYLDEYLGAAGIAGDAKGPLFRTAYRWRSHVLTANPMHRHDALRMIKRRALDAGLTPKISCHTFRATGITAYLQNGGTIEKAQQIAAHESPRTTKLYDRTSDELSLDEIERVVI